MTIAHDTSSESHTGTTGSVSEASFSWTHHPAGTPRGVVVWVLTHGSGGIISSVTYGGSTLTAVSGGEAADAGGGEGGVCTAYFLGSSVPTGEQSIVVNRTNNSTTVYAVAVTVTAATTADTDIVGVTLLQEDGTLSEVSVDDGSPGVDSMRYGAIMSGLSDPPLAGANSTVLQEIDLGVRVSSLVQENTAGQGSRPVGWSDGLTDDRAAVFLAVIELAGTPIAPIVSIGEDSWAVVNGTFGRVAVEDDTGDPITAREWKIISGPVDAGNVVGTDVMSTWTPTLTGSYVVRYTATNGVGASFDEINLEVGDVVEGPQNSITNVSRR